MRLFWCALLMIIVAYVFLLGGLSIGKEIGFGNPQLELAVGEYQLFQMGPNHLDNATVIALVRGKNEVAAPLYVTLNKNRFTDPVAYTTDLRSDAVIIVTKITDASGTRTVYTLK